MINLKRIIVCILLLSIIATLSGCASSEYRKFTDRYEDIYLSIAASIDITNTYESLKRLQSEENKRQIAELQEVLDNIKHKVPNNRKRVYAQQVAEYEGIVFLREAFKRWDNLTEDDKQRINIEMRKVDYVMHEYKKYKQSN